jgi:hypothetical protein
LLIPIVNKFILFVGGRSNLDFCTYYFIKFFRINKEGNIMRRFFIYTILLSFLAACVSDKKIIRTIITVSLFIWIAIPPHIYAGNNNEHLMNWKAPKISESDQARMQRELDTGSTIHAPVPVTPYTAQIIIDQDLGPDPCDFATMAIAHTFHVDGTINLLAVIGAMNGKNDVETLSVFNAWYGNDIPIGIQKHPSDKDYNVTYNYSRNDSFLWSPGYSAPKHIANEWRQYINDTFTFDSVKDGVTVYRETLDAINKKNSVTLLILGQLYNFRDLLESSSKAPGSNLSGIELIKQKVGRIIIMVGAGFLHYDQDKIRKHASEAAGNWRGRWTDYLFLKRQDPYLRLSQRYLPGYDHHSNMIRATSIPEWNSWGLCNDCDTTHNVFQSLKDIAASGISIEILPTDDAWWIPVGYSYKNMNKTLRARNPVLIANYYNTEPGISFLLISRADSWNFQDGPAYDEIAIMYAALAHRGTWNRFESSTTGYAAWSKQGTNSMWKHAVGPYRLIKMIDPEEEWEDTRNEIEATVMRHNKMLGDGTPRRKNRINKNDDDYRHLLMAYYPFNGNPNDKSGNYKHGKVEGATLTSDHSGVLKSAYEFDGVDDYISVPALNNVYEFESSSGKTRKQSTITAWVYRKTDTTWDSIWTGEWNDNGRFHLQFQPGNKLQFAVHGNSSSPTFNYVFDTKVWHHIAVVYDSLARTSSLYVNGSLEQTITFETAHPLRIDGISRIGDWNGNRNFDGKIDDVQLYSIKLSAKDIQKIATDAVALYPINETDNANGPSSPSNLGVKIIN